MWRLNWMADLSPRGLSNSCGIMINYRYFLEKAENNSHLYIEDKHIVADEQVLNWIKPFSSQL
jgi:malonyl-CoA decarboxylase